MIWPKDARYEVSPASEDVAMSDESMQQWIRVLDELEALLTENDATALSWTPPMDLGELPEAVRDRANRLAAAQSAAIAALQEVLADASVELALAPPAARARQSTSAVYLDVMG